MKRQTAQITTRGSKGKTSDERKAFHSIQFLTVEMWITFCTMGRLEFIHVH